jgi:uncharacterized protein
MIFGMLIARPTLLSAIEDALSRSPAVVLLGPRQAGKTTLAHMIAQARRKDGRPAQYLDLEAAADLRRLDDAAAFLSAQAGLVILDEVHRAPGLFPELRGLIDAGRRAELAGGPPAAGRFLLLGSASLELVKQASETLAGRVVYLDAPPLSADEAASAGIGVDTAWLRGGFAPSLLAHGDAASLAWRTDFIRSYLERDVPMFAPRMPSAMIGRLWTMLAHGQGQPLNAARLAQSLGVSAPMVTRYIDLLADLFLVRRLQPWSGNLNKRLVRAPKLYLTDSGLAHALLELGTMNALLGHPSAGASWEGFIIEMLIRAAQSGPARTALYFRTHDGAEIDLVFERAGRPEIAIEIKRSSAPKIEPGFAIACADLGVSERWCVAPVDAPYPARHGAIVMPLLEAARRLAG